MKKSKRKAAANKYRVAYSVTLFEYDEIEAANAEDAEDLAFSEGALVESGDVTNWERAMLVSAIKAM